MTYEEYCQKREEMCRENSYLVGTVLNEKEQQADALLTELKRELENSMDLETLFKMNLLANKGLINSRLYAFAQAIPKGSDLHVHATAIIPANRLCSFVASHRDLLVEPATCHIYHKNESHPAECFPLRECLDKGFLTKDILLQKWTVLGKQHREDAWEYFENLLCLFESIEYDLDIYYDYYVEAFQCYLDNHINHIEIHAVFSENYTHSLALAQTVKKAYFHVKDTHPDFIVSVICAGLKYVGIDKDVPRRYLENALRLREEVVDDYESDHPHPFIIGFDLLNEEDKSLSLKELAPMLLEYREKVPDFNLYIHCGESLMAQSNNLVDAYLLGATRVGHGMNLYRFPRLLQQYADKEICLEACPISNKALRYVKDLRLHPIAEYLKRGVTVALCSDDPVCQENETLTDDFFAGIVCWDLSLGDIKQLCINSILYAGIDKEQKSKLIASWKKEWNAFIDSQAE